MTKIIKLIGADDRFRASVAQLLKIKTSGHYVLGDDGDITLIDADSIDGRKAIASGLDDNAILLTVSPDHYEHALIVRKPVKVDELLKVLDEIDSQTDSEPIEEEVQPAQNTAGNPFAKYMDPDYLSKRKQPAVEEIEVEIVDEPEKGVIEGKIIKILETSFKYWKNILSEVKKIRPYTYDNEYFREPSKDLLHEMMSVYLQSDDIYFDMSHFMSLKLFKDSHLGKLSEHIHYFEYQDGLVILFSDGMSLSNLSVKSIYDFSQIKQGEVEIKRVESKELMMELINRFDEYYYDDVREVCTRAILVAAKGRIINKKNLKEPLGLMKRKEVTNINIPHAKEIDSVWGFRNISLQETTELLTDVNPYYIFSHYTLCDLYGFFDTDLVENKSKKHLDLNALLSELQKL